MSVESDLKNLIVERYGTVKAFSQSVGLPNSTLDSIFRRGILKASVTNIIKICDELGISADGLGEGKIVARSGSLNRELVLTPGEADAIKNTALSMNAAKWRSILRSPASMKLVLATLPPSSRTRPRRSAPPTRPSPGRRSKSNSPRFRSRGLVRFCLLLLERGLL